jgi:hypothetical protein
MKRISLRLGLLAALLITSARAEATAAAPQAERFSFVAMGCMPYSEDNFAAYERLLAEINRHQPAFTVHCGDTKKGTTPPTDEFLLRVRQWFDSIAGPLIYTPGDNEWTDVHTPAAGGHDPLVWLGKIRGLYFAEERSLGQSPLSLVTQRRDPAFQQFVENARWSVGGVVFATVHVVGSHNNHQPRVPGALVEFAERDAATAAWVRAAFAEANRTEAAGVALFFQADAIGSHRRTPEGQTSGFEQFLDVLEEEARRFAKPVLLVHADEHRYRHEQGVALRRGGESLENVARLETFGANDIHAVIVTVDPASKQVFLAGPLLVPGNRLPALPR